MRDISLLQPQLVHSFVHHHLGGYPGHRYVAHFGYQRHRPGSTGIGLQHIDHIVADGILHIHQAHHMQLLSYLAGVLLNGLQMLAGDAHWRNDASRIAGMNARLLDMLHHCGHKGLFAVGEGICLRLQSILEESVDENGPLWGDVHCRGNVPLQHLLVVYHLHPPSAQDV